MSEENNQILAEIAVGKLSGTKKVSKNENGEQITTLSFKGSTGDLHAWEQREYGIDDKIRTAYAERNDALETMVSDFATEQFEKNPGISAVEVDLGMGNGAENFAVVGKKTSFFPQKKDDGTVERAEKVTYGVMKHQTRRIISKDVRLHHEANQAKIEAAITAAMDKASLK